MSTAQSLPVEVEAYVGQIRIKIEDFLKLTGMPPTSLGKTAAGDPNLINHVRKGKRRLTFEMARRLEAFMTNHRNGAERSE